MLQRTYSYPTQHRWVMTQLACIRMPDMLGTCYSCWNKQIIREWSKSETEPARPLGRLTQNDSIPLANLWESHITKLSWSMKHLAWSNFASSLWCEALTCSVGYERSITWNRKDSRSTTYHYHYHYAPIKVTRRLTEMPGRFKVACSAKTQILK